MCCASGMVDIEVKTPCGTCTYVVKSCIHRHYVSKDSCNPVINEACSGSQEGKFGLQLLLIITTNWNYYGFCKGQPSLFQQLTLAMIGYLICIRISICLYMQLSCFLTFYRILATQLQLVAIGALCSYNPIKCVYGLHFSCVARPTSIQGVTASNMALQGRGCVYANGELRAVASANVQNSYNNLFV